MSVQDVMIGLSLFLAAVALVAHRHRLKPAGENFGAFAVHRSALAAMPVADRGQLTQTAEISAPYFDAVIVPSARGADHVRAAAITARNAGSCLVVLASGQTDASGVEALLAGTGHARHRYLILDFDKFSHRPVLPLRTFGHPLANQTGDLSHKRNAGLIIARVMGWRNVLFVDDDVQPIGHADLKEAAALLAGADRGGVRRRLVGWAINEFRDFSAVGHARTYGADTQVSFAGGGAMALSCDPIPPFFPPVYNEDMMLWLEMLRHDPNAACVVGTVTQQEYNPFDDPQRGAAQEFGEVLVEGMLRTPQPGEALRPEFWRSVLRDRRATLHRVSGRLAEHGVPNGVRVVQMALETHTDEWPALLAKFAADWDRDLALWVDALRTLPRTDQLDQVEAMLAHLLGRSAESVVDQTPGR